MINFDRYIPIEWADVSNFCMGPIHAERAHVLVMNLANYSQFAKNVDGILRLDLLSRSQSFVIDYTAKILYFGPTENSSQRSNPGGFLATIVVQGRPLRLCVDTGSPDIWLHENRLRKRLVNLQTKGEALTITMGRIKGTKVDLPDVSITGAKQVITVVLIDGPKEDTMPGVDGYLGTATLHPKRIEFDFTNSVMWLCGGIPVAKAPYEVPSDEPQPYTPDQKLAMSNEHRVSKPPLTSGSFTSWTDVPVEQESTKVGLPSMRVL